MKKIIRYVVKYLKDVPFLLLPSHMLNNHPICDAWDDKIISLLDEVDINPDLMKRRSEFSITIGNVILWNANYPYSYGGGVDYDDWTPADKVLPRHHTRYRLKCTVLRVLGATPKAD